MFVQRSSQKMPFPHEPLTSKPSATTMPLPAVRPYAVRPHVVKPFVRTLPIHLDQPKPLVVTMPIHLDEPQPRPVLCNGNVR